MSTLVPGNLRLHFVDSKIGTFAEIHCDYETADTNRTYSVVLPSGHMATMPVINDLISILEGIVNEMKSAKPVPVADNGAVA